MATKIPLSATQAVKSLGTSVFGLSFDFNFDLKPRNNDFASGWGGGNFFAYANIMYGGKRQI